MDTQSKRVLADIVIGGIYGGLFFLLLGGLYGGMHTWVFFGMLLLMLRTFIRAANQSLLYSAVLGASISLFILLIAYLRGETDQTVILSGILIWSITGVSFGILGWCLGVLVNFFLITIQNYNYSCVML